MRNIQYFILFLDGILTFISPCLLPMLPIYISYFAGGNKVEAKTNSLKNSMGFVLGFTLVFVTMGALAGVFGSFLVKYQTLLNIITGSIIVVFGLNYLGVLNIKLLNRTIRANTDIKIQGFFSAVLFGIVFSIGWTPCVGAFVGSALMMASSKGSVVSGVLMLLCYSIGLGVPFVFSAVMLGKLKSSFDFIKRNYKIINMVSGILLVLMGILMMTGYMGYFLSLLYRER